MQAKLHFSPLVELEAEYANIQAWASLTFYGGACVPYHWPQSLSPSLAYPGGWGPE